MDAIGNLLAPYSDELGKIAGTITCLQFLSGVFLMNDIRNQKSSDKYPPDPFIGGVVLSVLSIKLGVLMGDAATINVSLIGIIINVLFMLVFYYYASSEYKSKLWSKFGVGAAFTMACLAYSNFEDPEKIEFRFGMLITSILVALVGMPLLSLGTIMKNKSTEGLPFPLILAGTVVSTSWMLYGLSIKNDVVVYQNLFLLLLNAIQLSLFAIYPNKSSVESSESALKTNASRLSQNNNKKEN